jgi:hypothetical protein
MLRKATDKQLKWIKHWFDETDYMLSDYGITKPMEDLSMGEAGMIIGKSKAEIKACGYDSCEEYILSVGKAIKDSNPITKLTGYPRDKSEICKLREQWIKKGFELVNITTLCEVKMGTSGWCNDINEPDESIHHIQILYRNENIANVNANKITIIDDDKYVLLVCKDRLGDDFAIFMKVKVK